MPLGGRVIKQSLVTLFVIFFSVFCADKLSANQNPSSQLPITLNQNWTVCVEHNSPNEVSCRSLPKVGSIETVFENFNGYAIYRTSFSLENNLEQHPLSLFIPHLRDADKVYLNGELVGQTGSFPPSFEKATLYSRTYPLPSKQLKFGKAASNELVISVYNHARQGGISGGPPIINTTAVIYDEQIGAEGLLMLYVGIMLIIAAVQIFYFVAQPQSRDHLYFAAFCACEAVYILTYSNFAFQSGLHLNTIFRANIVLFGVLTLLFYLFLTHFFKCQIPKWFTIPIVTLLIVISLITVFIPIDHIYDIVHLLQALSIFVLVPFYLYLFYRAISEKLPYAKLMAWALCIFILAVVFDILVDLQVIPSFMNELEGLLSPIFLIGIFLILTLILIHKHLQYYRYATYDYLTNCLRRSAFVERLTEELFRIHRSEDVIVLALLDIDDFKQINDKYNHIMGDNILRTVATRTHDVLREFDLLGRYGGDEFIIAAQVSDQHDALQLLKRIHKNITEEPIIRDNKKTINVSVTIGGITTDPKHSATAEELIELADEILVKGKIKQKGRVHI